MEKYICDTCGYILETDLEKTNNGDMNCPICKNNMLTMEEVKGREDIQKLIEEDIKDEELDPKNEAKEELEMIIKNLIGEDVIETLKEQIFIRGNDECFKIIEKEQNAYIRYAIRQYFLKAGGKIPQGEPITI